jgi:hypothetical protein
LDASAVENISKRSIEPALKSINNSIEPNKAASLIFEKNPQPNQTLDGKQFFLFILDFMIFFFYSR